MNKNIGENILYSGLLIFIILLICFAVFRERINESELSMLYYFLLYTTGLPSVVSLVLLLVWNGE
jgi:hypothetical protein